MASRPKNQQVPDSWEEVDTAESRDRNKTLELPTAAQIHIIRNDFDDHTPYRPQIKIMQRRHMASQHPNKSHGGLECFEDLQGLKPLIPPPSPQITKSLADRQAQYETARERIFAQTPHQEQTQFEGKGQDKAKVTKATFTNKDPTSQS